MSEKITARVLRPVRREPKSGRVVYAVVTSELSCRLNGVPHVDRQGQTKASKLKDEVSVVYESPLPLEEDDLLEFDGRYHKIFRLRSHRVLPGAARQIADVVVLRPDIEVLMGSPEDEG